MGIFSFLFNRRTYKIKQYLEKDAVILDVRTKAEYEDSHLPNAVHIPVSELRDRIHEISALNRPVVAHCKSGVRSMQAVKFLKLNNIDAYNGGSLSAMKRALKQ